jgi:hypothetical protein
MSKILLAQGQISRTDTLSIELVEPADAPPVCCCAGRRSHRSPTRPHSPSPLTRSWPSWPQRSPDWPRSGRPGSRERKSSSPTFS